jgi:hypothetical protein
LPRSDEQSADHVDRTALERELVQRRILGAWAFLISVDDPIPLQRLREFLATESIPLPEPKR